jgi:hypothetical protein
MVRLQPFVAATPNDKDNGIRRILGHKMLSASCASPCPCVLLLAADTSHPNAGGVLAEACYVPYVRYCTPWLSGLRTIAG